MMSFLIHGCNPSLGGENTLAVEVNEPPANFENYNNICHSSSNESVRHAAAVEMAKTAKSFDDWDQVGICANWGGDLENTVAHKMFGLAVISDEFIEAYLLASRTNDTALANAARLKMFDMADVSGDFHSWFHVTLASRYDDEDMFFTSLYQMSDVAVTTDDWTWVFKMSPPSDTDNTYYRPLALEKLNKLTPSFDNWLDIAIKTYYEDGKNSQKTFQMVLIKMSQTAEDYYDWKWVYKFAPAGSDLQKLAFRKMAKLAE